MGFMDKAKKMAEQAQAKLDEAQSKINTSQGGEQAGSSGSVVEYDKHGRPIQPAGPTPDAGAPPAATPGVPPTAPAQTGPTPDASAPSSPPPTTPGVPRDGGTAAGRPRGSGPVPRW